MKVKDNVLRICKQGVYKCLPVIGNSYLYMKHPEIKHLTSSQIRHIRSLGYVVLVENEIP